jgi:hypothetical protein
MLLLARRLRHIHEQFCRFPGLWIGAILSSLLPIIAGAEYWLNYANITRMQSPLLPFILLLLADREGRGWKSVGLALLLFVSLLNVVRAFLPKADVPFFVW